MKIGLVSDTHGWFHPSLFDFFADVDELWHAGDIGDVELLDNLLKFKPVRAVYGNVDGAEVRLACKETLRFKVDEVKVFMTHIGGSPGHYDKGVQSVLKYSPPDLFVCGHSHIARVMFDRKYNFLYMNPGAAGYFGFHKFMTAARFSIEGKRIFDFELIDLGERGKVTAPTD